MSPRRAPRRPKMTPGRAPGRPKMPPTGCQISSESIEPDRVHRTEDIDESKRIHPINSNIPNLIHLFKPNTSNQIQRVTESNTSTRTGYIEWHRALRQRATGPDVIRGNVWPRCMAWHPVWPPWQRRPRKFTEGLFVPGTMCYARPAKLVPPIWDGGMRGAFGYCLFTYDLTTYG